MEARINNFQQLFIFYWAFDECKFHLIHINLCCLDTLKRGTQYKDKEYIPIIRCGTSLIYYNDKLGSKIRPKSEVTTIYIHEDIDY